MQITRKRILASRANGARSRGPVTPEGKQRSAVNARRHGLLSQSIVLENECQETFDALLQQHLAKLTPTDDVEHSAVEEMAAATWRLRRLWAVESTLLDAAAEQRTEPTPIKRIAGAFAQLAAGPELPLLERYESRLHRMYQRSLYNLLVLRQVSQLNDDQLTALDVLAIEAHSGGDVTENLPLPFEPE